MSIRYHELYWQIGTDCRWLLSTSSIHGLLACWKQAVLSTWSCHYDRFVLNAESNTRWPIAFFSNIFIFHFSDRTKLKEMQALIWWQATPCHDNDSSLGLRPKRSFFRFAFLYWSFQSRVLRSIPWCFCSLTNKFSIVPYLPFKSAERFRTGIMAILMYAAEDFWRWFPRYSRPLLSGGTVAVLVFSRIPKNT